MKFSSIMMILCSILMTSGAQIMLKAGMSNKKTQYLLASGDYLASFISVATSPWILGGLLLFAASVGLWLVVLASVPLSIAYPFVALGICLTTAAGTLIFHEPMTALKLAGTGLIVLGIFCIAASRQG